MTPLRTAVPKRRVITKVVSTWGEHKPDLRIDFNQKCGYCDSYDGYRNTYYEVDHFIPKSFFAPRGNITLTQYSNLVYSCKFCNNKKLHKWPSQCEINHNDGQVGFIDPCDNSYDDQFYRTAEGAIMWKTQLGKWMYSEAFRFDERERSIKLLYNMHKLKITIEGLANLLTNLDSSTEEYQKLELKIGKFSFVYFQYHNELIDYYK